MDRTTAADQPEALAPPPAKRLKPAGAPPAPVFRIVLALRNWLLRLADRLVPAQIPVLERLGSYYLLHAVHAATKLGIADRLVVGPMTSAELARASGAGEEPLARLMRALASHGVFTIDAAGRWMNNRLSLCLVSGAPGSLRDLALFVGAPYHLHAWEGFVDSVRTGAGAFGAAHGRGLFDYYRDHASEAEHFAGAMTALTELDAPALAAAYPFAALGEAQVCDVAGGRGTLLATILARHVRLRGVLFDEAQVVEGARPLLDAHGVADRVKIVSGNFFREVPAGCAVYLLKDILHDWDDDRALEILKVVRAAMTPSSRLLIAEMVVDRVEERYFGTLLDLEMLAILDGGRQRSEAQFRALLARAGLDLTRIVRAASPTSLVEAAPVVR